MRDRCEHSGEVYLSNAIRVPKGAHFYIFIVMLLLISVAAPAQDIPIGTWRTHFSYNRVSQLETNGTNLVYAANESGLFILDQEDNSINVLSKLDGLQEQEVSSLHYHGPTSALYIGYQSGNLDIIVEGEIINIDLITDSQVIGSKTINDILDDGDNVYLLTDFGVLKFNPQTFVVTETVREIGNDGEPLLVHQGSFLNDTLYIATEEGVLATNVVNNINLADPSGWRRFGADDGLIQSPFQLSLAVNSELIVGSSENGLFQYLEEGSWTKLSQLDGASFVFSEVSNERALISTNNGLFALNDQLNLIEIEDNLVNHALAAIELADGNLFVGDDQNGLIALTDAGSQSVIPSGPVSNDIFRLRKQSNGVYGFAGTYDESFISGQNREGLVYQFENGQWNNNMSGVNLPEFNDAVDGVYQNELGRLVVALAGDGLLVINDDGSSEIIDASTLGSTLISTFGNVTIPSIFNSQEGLWILNYGASSPLHLWAQDDSWTSYPLVSTTPRKVIGDQRQLYMINASTGRGLIVFDKSTGESRLLTDDPGLGGLANNNVNAIALDRDGLLWIGTNEGISVLTNPLSAFSETVDAIEPIFENRPLLRDEEITAIAVDGGDRKWIGTTSGLWLFDPEADRQIFNFTIENSPLPANEILDLALDDDTGEIFIATEGGIVSYRDGASRGGSTHSDVKVFPNPVNADFTGTVGISGLVEDAQVRITDASGKLIWRTRAAGGTATWEVRDYNGNRATTGVYFIFSADDDGEETFVGKIAVIN